MGKGRYLKAAERACARKARFETAAAAESFVERRYRSYRCVVCGGYHLTSGQGDRREEPVEAPRKEPPGPTLRDLDWSAVLDPKPKKVSSPPPTNSATPTLPSPKGEEASSPFGAVCTGPVGKDGRTLLVVAGRLVKSKKVEAGLRSLMTEGVTVEIDDSEPPRVLRVVERQ